MSGLLATAVEVLDLDLTNKCLPTLKRPEPGAVHRKSFGEMDFSNDVAFSSGEGIFATFESDIVSRNGFGLLCDSLVKSGWKTGCKDSRRPLSLDWLAHCKVCVFPTRHPMDEEPITRWSPVSALTPRKESLTPSGEANPRQENGDSSSNPGLQSSASATGTRNSSDGLDLEACGLLVRRLRASSRL